MLTNVLIFCRWPSSSKNIEEGKNKKKCIDEINDELLISLTDVEIELKVR